VRAPAQPPLSLSALRVRRLGEPDRDFKAAAGSGVRGDGGVVGVGDGLDDREAEPDAVGTGLGLRAESFEGLEEAREFPGWDKRAGVGDGEQGASCVDPGCDFDSAVGDVVSDRVGDEVGGESLEEGWIAGRDSRLECHDAVECAQLVSLERLGCDRCDVDGFPPQTSALAPGEGKQRLEQPFLPLAGGDDALAHLPQSGRVCVRVSERGLRQRELEGDLAAQLVSGVGEEAAVRFGEVTGECRQRPTAPFRKRRPVDASRIHGLLSRDQAGHSGRGDYPEGVLRSAQLPLPLMSIG
jgi:hypothetical protein